MKGSAINIIVSIIALLVGGCVTTPQKWTPVTHGAPKWFLGFSIQPPQGQDWSFQQLGYNWINYKKETKRKEKHTVIAMAGSQPVLELESIKKDFIGYVETTSKAERSDSRFKFINEEISPLIIGRAECGRVDFKVEDHGVPFAFGSTYILQGFDILCLHPDSPYMLVRFGYSQRFEEGETPLMLKNELDPFIKSIIFDEDIQNRFSIGPLLGVYAYDKFTFFPDGRNRSKERLLMNALKEGGCKGAEIYTLSPATEQRLAIEYDVAWVIAAKAGVTPDLGCILGKVGRWDEAAEAFQAASTSSPQSADIMGNIGVAAHVIGRFKESVEYFKKAKSMEPDYLMKRPQQKMILNASKEGASVFRE